MYLSTDYTDRTKERIKVYSQIPQIKIKGEKLFSDRIYRLNKKNTDLSTDSTDWTEERILVYSQIPQIEQKILIYPQIPHIEQKKKNTYLSTDCTDLTRIKILVYPQITQMGHRKRSLVYTQIEQKKEYWFIHRFHRLDKKENTDLSTDWKRMYLLELPRSKVSGW